MYQKKINILKYNDVEIEAIIWFYLDIKDKTMFRLSLGRVYLYQRFPVWGVHDNISGEAQVIVA